MSKYGPLLCYRIYAIQKHLVSKLFEPKSMLFNFLFLYRKKIITMHLQFTRLTIIVTLLFLNMRLMAQVALAFNGVNNYMSSNGTPVLNNQARTVDAWIKTTSTVTTQMVICDWGTTSTNGSRFTLNTISGKLRIEVGGVGIIGTTSVNTGVWTHVTAVYNPAITSGPNVFLYINGQLELSGNFTGYTSLTTSNAVGFRIGVRVDGINYFNGAIDEVKVYNYARTQSQIAADTMEVCVPETGLVAYYRLNEGLANAVNTNSTATDYSGNANTGTLNSFTLSGTTSNWVTGRVRAGGASISASPGAFLCSGNTVTLSTNATSNYTWSNGNSSSTLITLSPSISTTYSISTTNSLNCVSVTTIAVIVNSTVPNPSVAIANSTICPGMSTSFTASGAPTFTWSGGVINGQPFTPTTTTAYSLQASNGCGISNSIYTITVAPLQVNTTVNNTFVCSGSTCALTASAPVNGFTWMPGSQTGSTILVAPISTTIYTVTASNGTCVSNSTIQIVPQPRPSITLSQTIATICNGDSVIVIANGAGANGTYTWLPSGAHTTSMSMSPTASTLYTVMATNSIGCSSTANFPVIVLTTPTVTVLASKTVVCLGDSLLLNASGADTYLWSNGSTLSSLYVKPTNGNTNYTVVGTNTNTGCADGITIGANVIIPNIVYTSSVTLCQGKSFTLSASGASTYTWNSFSVGNSGQFSVNPSTTTTYTLLALTSTLSANCLSTRIATVFVNPLPTVAVIANNPTICAGEAATLQASGALTYSWTNGSITPSIVITPSSTSVYTVLGTDVNNCTSAHTYTQQVRACNQIQETNAPRNFVKLFPNPSNGNLHLTFTSNGYKQVQVYDLVGKHMMELNHDKTELDMDLSHLPKGVYMVTVQCVEGIQQLRLVLH